MNSAIDVVDEIKAKLVAAREPGVDRDKIQSEISELQNQLTSIATSSSFSGENWLSFDGSAFSGLPPQDFNGTLNVQVTADDGTTTVADNFSLNIQPVNDAPAVQTPLQNQASPEDAIVLFAVPAGAISYFVNLTLGNLPSCML